MAAGIWIISIVMGLVLLSWGFRVAVRRGGRKVQPVNPQDLIIYPQTEARVTRLKDGDLQLQWNGAREAVQVFTGPTPENIDGQHPIAETSPAREITVSGISPTTRPYFKIAFSGGPRDGKRIKVAERHVPLEGAYNFRDVGGYRTQAGQQIRWGQLFRADELSELTDADLNYLTMMGLRTVVDLRSPFDLRGKNNRMPAGAAYHHLPIYQKEPVRRYLSVLLFQRHKLAQTMGASYLIMAEEHAKAYGAVLRLLADPQNLPAVYHCSAGKDRTGMVTAYLYALLDVPTETIIADYSLSNLGFDHYYNEFIASGRIDRWHLPPEEFRALFMVDPAWMKNLLHHIHTHYGAMQNYLIQKAGLDQITLDRIRENFLA